MRLSKIDGQEGSDYINASFVDVGAYIPASFSLVMYYWYYACSFRDTIALIAILLPKVGHLFLNVVMSENVFPLILFGSGPMASTTVDFWRMVWKYQVKLIVMLTGLLEAGKVS